MNIKKLNESLGKLKQSLSESWGFELWDSKGNKMYVAGSARNPDHAVELIKKWMEKKKDRKAEGLIIKDGEVVDTKTWNEIF